MHGKCVVGLRTVRNQVIEKRLQGRPCRTLGHLRISLGVERAKALFQRGGNAGEHQVKRKAESDVHRGKRAKRPS